MRFSITAFAILTATLATTGSSFKITTFTDENCTQIGEPQVDIWDNSCAKWPKPFKAFKMLYYGSEGQEGWFHNSRHCKSTSSIMGAPVYNDPRSRQFQLNQCFGFHGETAQAVASHKAPV